jgi:low affinity Fe/Cu permease
MISAFFRKRLRVPAAKNYRWRRAARLASSGRPGSCFNQSQTQEVSMDKTSRAGSIFERLAMQMTEFTGSTPAFSAALAVIIVWAMTGPIFRYSNTWQLVINTGTTIVTFLMVFLIQRAQNKDSRAVHLKLNELIAAVDGASNRLLNAQDLTEEDLDVLRNYYLKLAEMCRRDHDLTESHSIEEAEGRHRQKDPKKKARGT